MHTPFRLENTWRHLIHSSRANESSRYCFTSILFSRYDFTRRYSTIKISRKKTCEKKFSRKLAFSRGKFRSEYWVTFKNREKMYCFLTIENSSRDSVSRNILAVITRYSRGIFIFLLFLVNAIKSYCWFSCRGSHFFFFLIFFFWIFLFEFFFFFRFSLWNFLLRFGLNAVKFHLAVTPSQLVTSLQWFTPN